MARSYVTLQRAHAYVIVTYPKAATKIRSLKARHMVKMFVGLATFVWRVIQLPSAFKCLFPGFISEDNLQFGTVGKNFGRLIKPRMLFDFDNDK